MEEEKSRRRRDAWSGRASTSVNEETRARERAVTGGSSVFTRAEHDLQPDGRVNEKEAMPEHHGEHTSRGRKLETNVGECVCACVCAEQYAT